MVPRDDSPQIGMTDIDRSALSESGSNLFALAETLGIAVDAESARDAPTQGWRVLRRMGDSLVLGAPIDPGSTTWRLAYVTGDVEAPTAHVYPDPEQLRPSKVERRGGLALRWPAMMTPDAGADGFIIDIVNTADTRWVPGGDDFHVVGVLTDPDVSEFGFGWMSMGHPRAVPLEPGEYARVRVAVNQGQWTGREPGRCDLHAVLVGLDLHADPPLALELSAETIAAQVAQGRGPTPSSEDLRRGLDQQIAHLRTQIGASASLVSLAEKVATADSDDDAIARIGELLVCDEDNARSIYYSSLSELRPGNASVLEARIAESIERRDQL